MESNDSKITGTESNDELFYLLFDGTQPYREEAVAELHKRGLTDTQIVQGILSAKEKSTLPADVADAEVNRGRQVVSDFFKKLEI